MIDLKIQNESSQLKIVVLGIANDFGGTPKLENCYDPKSKEHINDGTFPVEDDLIIEIEGFRKVLEKYNVEVIRPENIEDLNQIFVRDISFVIENKIIISNIIEERKEEITATLSIFDLIDKNNIIKIPKNIRIEGGDVMPWNNYIFVGYSENEDFEKYKVARTNKAAVDFLKNQFPQKDVKSFELNKSDSDPRENALHLDCCFQPISRNMAIIYSGGFKNKKDVDFLVNLFSVENIIFITKEEMYNMNSNIFSISEKIIVSEKNFTRLNKELRKKGFIVEEIPYSEIAKMEGSLRCSTLPLKRK